MKKYLIITKLILFVTYSGFGQKSYTDSLKLIINTLSLYIENHPNDFNSYLKRADCEFELSNDKFGYGFEEKALMDYNTAILLNPKSDTAFNKRGYLYQISGKDTLAILDFIKAIELNLGYIEAYFNKGLSEYTRGKYEIAINDFTKAIELNSKYEYAYMFRGYAKFFMGGQNQSACKDWQKAYELGSWTSKENIDKYCK